MQAVAVTLLAENDLMATLILPGRVVEMLLSRQAVCGEGRKPKVSNIVVLESFGNIGFLKQK